MKRDLRPIREKLRSDKRCQRLLGIFNESAIYKIAFNSLTEEVMDIHKTRSVRFLSRNGNDGRFIEKIVDSSLRDQANRSRLAEISMQCFRAQASLNEALEPLQEYLIMTYGPEMSFVRTKDERKQLVEMALRPFYKFISQCGTLRQLTDIVISDIDKAAWSLKLLVSTYELNNRPEQSL